MACCVATEQGLGGQPLVEEVDVHLPGEADATEDLDRRCTHARQGFGREGLCDRRGMGDALRAQRKAIALAFKKSKRKKDFDWTKIRRLSRNF